jgi:hypothetical protein
MNYEMRMILHEMIENATQALKRADKNDNHWKTLVSLLRFRSEDLQLMVKEIENGEEE